MSETKTIPPGYWQDANGSLVPVSKIKAIDKDRSQVVTDLCEQAEKESARLMGFKTSAMHAVHEFIERSLAEYDVKHGGKKGNVTLINFDAASRSCGRWPRPSSLTSACRLPRH